ncbi:ABC transporter [Gordonia sp. CNJ-863]|uniref:ABC transporter permease n=1 Tax=Gordonia TaxID=2053 RepID=UPI000963B9BB|nr:MULTISPECIES: ABC transporter permease [Gordonia]OLT41548.1 ABC transporter [Gordonia sp. CNJ-863]UPW15721.1 ABC transporter permease [Gordonia amicalis]
MTIQIDAIPERISAFGQWWALTVRGLAGMTRTGEVLFALISPVFLAVCFYLPLRSIMNATPGMDYAQFLMPIITLQAVGFMASSAAMRSAFDGAKGISTRFRTMPMPLIVPVLARLSVNAVLLAISLVCATLASLVIGWRAEGGVSGTLGLFAIAAAVGLLVAVLADAIGLLAGSPEATSQALSLPILILGMLSTGFVPENQFPDWIGPFVRNQPISQFATAMRALNEGTATREILMPSLWWCVGLAVLAVVLMSLGVRKIAR